MLVIMATDIDTEHNCERDDCEYNYIVFDEGDDNDDNNDDKETRC